MSSSQSANTNTINPSGTTPYQFSNAVLRDPSDYTRMVRERLEYASYKSGSTIAPGLSEHLWPVFGNNFRLSYLQGKLKCPNTTCTGNAFYGNGPYVNNVGGVSPS